jgi:type 1 fimbria pilin
MRLRSRIFALLSASLLLATLAVAQGKKNSSEPAAGEQSFSGTVSDSMCGKTHMMAGSSAAECTRACVKDGSDYALVSGDKVYTLKGNKAAIDKFAGESATVKGKLNGSTIQVSSIAAK